jgi:hypothetical protein
MSVELWTSAPFHDEVRAWVGESLRPTGLGLTGRSEQPHARAWSSAIRFETSGEPVWFKVDGPGSRHEPALLRLLAERVPDLAPEVLAVDPGRGWSLCRDAGPVLRQVLAAEDSWPVWEQVLVRYAEAQLALSGARGEVLATGVVEVSPATLPAHARLLVEELAAEPVEHGGLSAHDRDRLAGALAQLDDWCAELAASPVPDSVQHDDLHSANVCCPPGRPERVIDWGDTTWGCPLGTMLATMNSLAFYIGKFVEGRPIDAPPVLRARDAYLEPFTGYAARADLLRLVELARRTGCVGKALSYQRALQDAPLPTHAELEFPVRTWLLELVDGAPVAERRAGG